MTIHDKLLVYATARGMLPSAAREVMAALEREAVEMKGRWDDRVDDYPPVMFAVLALSFNRLALAWIDANLPNAWYRELFVVGGTTGKEKE